MQPSAPSPIRILILILRFPPLVLALGVIIGALAIVFAVANGTLDEVLLRKALLLAAELVVIFWCTYLLIHVIKAARARPDAQNFRVGRSEVSRGLLEELDVLIHSRIMDLGLPPSKHS